MLKYMRSSFVRIPSELPRRRNLGKFDHGYFFLFSLAVQPTARYDLLVPRGLVITHNDAPQSVGLLWTSDQLVAKTST
jgi:hypothetical protein